METFIDGLGVGLMILGLAIFIMGLGARITYLQNMFRWDSLPLWFRGEGLVLLGGSVTILGVIVAGRLPWPLLFVDAVFAAVAVLLLRARFHW